MLTVATTTIVTTEEVKQATNFTLTDFHVRVTHWNTKLLASRFRTKHQLCTPQNYDVAFWMSPNTSDSVPGR